MTEKFISGEVNIYCLKNYKYADVKFGSVIATKYLKKLKKLGCNKGKKHINQKRYKSVDNKTQTKSKLALRRKDKHLSSPRPKMEQEIIHVTFFLAPKTLN